MRTPLALTALLVASACAPTPGEAPRGPRECFFVNEVRSFSSNDDRRVYVRAARDEVFELTTPACFDVDWSHAIGIRARGGGSSVCSGFDAELIVPDIGGGTRTCQVTDVRRLSEAEVEALDPRATP